jgi:protein gp37
MSGKELNAAFKAALLAAIEGTGLEGQYLDASDPDSGECMPWLQQEGSGGSAGYWIACRPGTRPCVPAGAQATELWADYLYPAGTGDPDNSETLSERVFDLRLPGSRDPQVLAAVTVTAVLGHQLELTRRTGERHQHRAGPPSRRHGQHERQFPYAVHPHQGSRGIPAAEGQADHFVAWAHENEEGILMAAITDIDWTDATDNPTTQHCDPVGPECFNCYAQDIANHWHGRGYFTSAAPSVIPARLLIPWRVKKVREAHRRFLTSMSDPFHNGLSFDDQALLWGWMAADWRHVHQSLTKRDGIMESRLNSPRFVAAARASLGRLEDMAREARRITPWRQQMLEDISHARANWTWPLPNVWTGVSAGLRETAERRLTRLLATPAATRIVSCEPLLEDLGDLSRWLATGDIHQVIGGGESGRRHRPVNLDHARSLRDQCIQHSVPFWWKQNGGVTHDAGGDLLDGRRWKQFPVPRPGVLV